MKRRVVHGMNGSVVVSNIWRVRQKSLSFVHVLIDLIHTWAVYYIRSYYIQVG